LSTNGLLHWFRFSEPLLPTAGCATSATRGSSWRICWLGPRRKKRLRSSRPRSLDAWPSAHWQARQRVLPSRRRSRLAGIAAGHLEIVCALRLPHRRAPASPPASRAAWPCRRMAAFWRFSSGLLSDCSHYTHVKIGSLELSGVPFVALLATQKDSRAKGFDGVLTLGIFKRIFICHRDHFVVLEPR
jgi:hypothetical protein